MANKNRRLSTYLPKRSEMVELATKIINTPRTFEDTTKLMDWIKKNYYFTDQFDTYQSGTPCVSIWLGNGYGAYKAQGTCLDMALMQWASMIIRRETAIETEINNYLKSVKLDEKSSLDLVDDLTTLRNAMSRAEDGRSEWWISKIKIQHVETEFRRRDEERKAK